MCHYSLRKGEASDKDWLLDLYRATLRSAIENTWGWDEAFQQENFNIHLSPEKFEIISINDNHIGGFLLVEEVDNLWLEMLLIHPDHQGMGVGKKVIEQLQRQSITKNKVLKLSVIKANPVKLFYEKLGFQLYEEDEAMFKMVWPLPEKT